jgi:SAM-dependent methyltransferase
MPSVDLQHDPETYCIKPSYTAREAANAYDDDAHSYWTEARQAASEQFQYSVYLACGEELRRRQEPSLLELGCGPARKTGTLLAPHAAHLVLIDQSSVEPLARQHCPNAEFQAANLDEPVCHVSGNFDVILCADVIEHLLFPNHCLELIRRCLKPGGLAFLSTPERDIVRGSHCCVSPNHAHVREWNQSEFAAYLSSQGFEVLRHELHPQQRLLFRWRLVRTLTPWIRTAGWHGCQLAIVGLGDDVLDSSVP